LSITARAARIGIFHNRHASHGTSITRATFHDGGIQLVRTSRCEDRALARIEDLVVLHRNDGGLRGVERATAIAQDFSPCFQCFLQACLVKRFLLRRHGAARDHASPAMDGEAPLRRFRRLSVHRRNLAAREERSRLPREAAEKSWESLLSI
jgi:hypothetical protein